MAEEKRTPQQESEFWLERCAAARKKHRFGTWLLAQNPSDPERVYRQAELDALLEMIARLEEIEREEALAPTVVGFMGHPQFKGEYTVWAPLKSSKDYPEREFTHLAELRNIRTKEKK